MINKNFNNKYVKIKMTNILSGINRLLCICFRTQRRSQSWRDKFERNKFEIHQCIAKGL